VRSSGVEWAWVVGGGEGVGDGEEEETEEGMVDGFRGAWEVLCEMKEGERRVVAKKKLTTNIYVHKEVCSSRCFNAYSLAVRFSENQPHITRSIKTSLSSSCTCYEICISTSPFS
jgi:hypothetical protein